MLAHDTKEIKMLIDVVNTVNTDLNDFYDFGIHAHGCRDVARCEAKGCEIYEAIEVDSPAQYIIDDEADFAAQDQTGFIYKVHACTRRP